MKHYGTQGRLRYTMVINHRTELDFWNLAGPKITNVLPGLHYKRDKQSYAYRHFLWHQCTNPPVQRPGDTCPRVQRKNIPAAQLLSQTHKRPFCKGKTVPSTIIGPACAHNACAADTSSPQSTLKPGQAGSNHDTGCWVPRKKRETKM